MFHQIPVLLVQYTFKLSPLKNLLHRIGWADNTWEDDSGEDDSWYPEMEMDDGSSSEEEEMMGEDSECSDDSDIDYVPYLCVRYV